jgi:hypothetical protein
MTRRRADSSARPGRGRPASTRTPERDADYVLDLCDEVLGELSLREHTFVWLRGDPNPRGTRRPLPVDAYYPQHDLVIEYRERQHDEPVPFFDKPDKPTISGVHRGEQRRLYDARRDTEIPAHGLRLVILRPAQLDADGRGRLRRNRASDRAALEDLLADPRTESPLDKRVR